MADYIEMVRRAWEAPTEEPELVKIIQYEQDMRKVEAINFKLDRIESKLDQLLLRKKRVKGVKGDPGDYSLTFLEAWSLYPKRAGSNPKRRAYDAFNRRIHERHESGSVGLREISKMMVGTQCYAAFCDATGKTGTEFVLQACTFFGPERHYENDWAIPAQKVRIPADNDEMLRWAIDAGFRQPREGESWQDYRRYVTEKVQS